MIRNQWYAILESNEVLVPLPRLRVRRQQPLHHNWSAMIFNTVVAHQGHRVVTKRPMRSDLKIGEKLIPGDAPIIAYRRRRQELLEAAQG